MMIKSGNHLCAQRKGFSLLEVTIALGAAGLMISGIWQLSGTANSMAQARIISGQVLAVSNAAKSYAEHNRSALLSALPSIDSAGEVLFSSMQASGELPSDFVNQNSYGQTYRIFVKREDGGAAGADADDTLVVLVVSNGGVQLSDQMGNEVINELGVAGGFIYSDSSTTVRGTSGGWQVNLAGAGWSTIGGYTPAVGHLAVLANLLPSQGSGGGSGGASALDDFGDAVTDYTNGTVFLGFNAGNYGSLGVNNTALGDGALDVVATGSRNTGAGAYALQSVTTGSDNTAYGYQAGQTITTGSNNVMIGASTDPSSPTASNELNIANALYGNVSTGQLNIGQSTLASGVTFDMGSKVDTMRGAVGTTAQRPTCNASLVGAQRWNTTTQLFEVCTNSGWTQPSLIDAAYASTPAAPYTQAGYFVMTETKWDGNMGGAAGMDQKCLTELTTKTNWKYYNDALAGGQLTSDYVKSFRCISGGECLIGMPYAVYYFARVGNPDVGGAAFTTDSGGYGPNNSLYWSSYNYFATQTLYWTGRFFTSGATSFSGSGVYDCTGWTTNSSSVTGAYGNTHFADYNRWGSYYGGQQRSCDQLLPIVCFVHPRY